jgi:hypothetical protein
MTPQDCINETAQLLASGILNTGTDFCIILLPIPIILQLKLPRRQQIILILVFSGGIIVCIAGVVRTYYTYQMTTGYDKTWSGYEVILSGSIEMYIIIVSVLYLLAPQRTSDSLMPFKDRRLCPASQTAHVALLP